ncbi:hypothetical protein C9439_03555 [archaeon SCG-AAA382B04]|nr:hypothetical protein C9439_03555 [archaeon SCG-AAA382B04]
MMSKKRWVLILVIVLLVVALGGIGSVYFGVVEQPRARDVFDAPIVGDFVKEPEVDVVSASWGEITEEESELIVGVRVDNPNPVGLVFGDLLVEYDVSMNDVLMDSGVERDIELGSGVQRINFSVYLNNSRMDKWWVSHLENDELTVISFSPRVVLDFGFRSFSFDVPVFTREFSTDLLERFNREVYKEVRVLDTTVLVVNETRASWGEVSGDESVIDMEWVVDNPNSFDVPLKELRFDLFMNGVKVGEGSSENISLESGRNVVDGSLVIDNSKMGEWWVSHLRNDSVSSVRVEVSGVVGLFGEEFEVGVGSYSDSFETDLVGEF